jgi:N,N-dimethylformamidase beta subunit-like, C-terminal
VAGVQRRGRPELVLPSDLVDRLADAALPRQRRADAVRPEAALVGVQYAGWDERTLPNVPYTVTGAKAAPWLFKGSGLHNGSTFGKYGIEIDKVTADSPPGMHVLAQIPDDFGPGISANMAYYERGAAKVFAAGVMNFGASANWPVVSTLLANLWGAAERPLSLRRRSLVDFAIVPERRRVVRVKERGKGGGDEPALLRELNERIHEVALRAGDDGQAYTFLCECGCWREVRLPLVEYEPHRPVYAPGHGP